MTNETLNDIKKKLEVCPDNQSNSYETSNESFKVYRESNKVLRIPRFFGLNYFETDIESKYKPIESIDVKFEGKLKDKLEQPKISEITCKHLQEKNCGILSLPTGYGKTTIALHVISQMKMKTIVIVHKEFLMNQWIERINQFLPSARIGIIQGSKIKVKDKDIVMVMLQSVSMKDYEKGLFDSFGLTIIDETHHVCAKVFSNMLFKICTKHMLGLSATPIRKDGLTKVLNWFLGDIFYMVERENQTNVDVKTCNMQHDDIKFPLNRLGKANIPEAINQLCSIEMRNQYIISLIKSLYETTTRNILVLSDRRNHCEKLKNEMNISDCGLYIGGMKNEEFMESEKCRIIIGTYSLAHEGLDIPKLDTLILATPKSDIVQSVGRILRETGEKPNNPQVYDIRDKWGLFEYQYYKRRQFYIKTGFNVKEICVE